MTVVGAALAAARAGTGPVRVILILTLSGAKGKGRIRESKRRHPRLVDPGILRRFAPSG